MRRAGLAVPSITIILGEGDKLVPRAGAEALTALLPPGAPPRTLATPRDLVALPRDGCYLRLHLCCSCCEQAWLSTRCATRRTR